MDGRSPRYSRAAPGTGSTARAAPRQRRRESRTATPPPRWRNGKCDQPVSRRETPARLRPRTFQMSDRPHRRSKTERPRPRGSAMVVDQDYDRVNRPVRPTTAASQCRTAVPFEPLRPRSAHVVELRPITVHQAADDCSNESQDMHPRLPRHVPLAFLLAPALDDWREVVRPQYEMRLAGMGRHIRRHVGLLAGVPARDKALNAAHAAFGVGETSLTAPFQPLSVTSNTMPSGVAYLTS